MDQIKIGAFIRTVRKDKKLTQEQLAEKLGVSQKSISRWETGKTMPDYALLPMLCEALDISAAELLAAERIEGNQVSKEQVMVMTNRIIGMVNEKKNIRYLMAAILSLILTLACVVGLYRYHFNISIESTVELEHAINQYHFLNDVSADVLEMQAIGNQLFVLYGENEYPDVCGLACLEKGIFGKYRIISCDDTNSRWINVKKTTVGNTYYCVTYCANRFSDISSYGICGMTDMPDVNRTIEDPYVIYKLDYPGTPFLQFTEIDHNVTIAPFYILNCQVKCNTVP